MPGKSRQARRRLSRKRKRRQVSPAIAPQQQAVTQAPKPAAPSARVSTPLATVTAARYPYILTELRRIGILTGIMLVILIVLALILS